MVDAASSNADDDADNLSEVVGGLEQHKDNPTQVPLSDAVIQTQ